jgi:hypothetical protein
LRASLLQLLHSIRSERQLVERLEFDMLFRWFVGLMIDEKAFDAFSKNRDRLLTHAIAQAFLSSLLGLPEVKGLLSAEHFSVDGTMLKAWASMKSFRPKAPRAKARGTARSAVSCRVKMRGLDKVRAAFVFAMAAYNIVRLPKLLPKLLAPRGEVRPAT